MADDEKVEQLADGGEVLLDGRCRALPAELLGDNERAERVYREFAAAIVCKLPMDGWALGESQLRAVITEIEARRGRGFKR